jgi:hypothetical protein
LPRKEEQFRFLGYQGNKDMEDKDRIKFALEHVADKSVFIFERVEWERIVDENGEPTKLEDVPPAIYPLVSMASHVMTAASGIYNPSPGIDVVRSDPGDKPYIYNIDHYTVFEHLACDPLYHEALKVAGVEATEELDKFVQDHVFVVGPYCQDNHWVVDIPEYIKKARQKE